MADCAEPIESAPFPPWNLTIRILFRFFCVYWVLWLSPVWRPVAPLVATRVFRVSAEAAAYKQTGSGDTALHFVEVALCLAAALGGALVWSLLDRKRREYVVLHGWLRLLLRYFMALMLLSYGYAKVFPQQFPANSLLRMTQEYGTFSPMGAVWSFMGASREYTFFAGAAEVAAGVLLFFRRTTSLGALLALGVMANVAALNYFYDVPVKLHSTHYLLMALFLLAPDFRRLMRVFLLNQTAEPADLRYPDFGTGRARLAARIVWVIVFLGAVGGGALAMYRQTAAAPQRPPIYGVFAVESGAPEGWHRVVFESKGRLAIRTSDGSVRFLTTAYDEPKQVIALTDYGDGNDSYRWSETETGRLVLTGTRPGAGVPIRLRRIDEKLLLRTRGFHWIQEFPFNR